MNLLSPFIVLIESRRLRAAWALTLAALAFTAGALGLHSAHASTATSSKIAADLQQVIAAPSTPKLNWANDIRGVRYVKALVISNTSDSDLVALRADVLARGGSVYTRFLSVSALSVLLPAHQVAAIAQRSDVQGVSPNRLTARTASTLESTTGALNLRTYRGGTYTGLDGAGVGIAVLDSGIMWDHLNLADPAGASRVSRSVDFQKVGDAAALGVKDWALGVDTSSALYPGSETMATYDSKIANDKLNKVDLYGHGTHVASVAAGRGAYQAKDSTGLAPGAKLFDVKVLDSRQARRYRPSACPCTSSKTGPSCHPRMCFCRENPSSLVAG